MMFLWFFYTYLPFLLLMFTLFIIIFLNWQKFVYFNKIGKYLSKWLMVKHDILLPTKNNQEEIIQLLNNIYEIDKKIKEYYHYINENKS